MRQSWPGRLGINTTPLRMDSQAKYAVVARGEADIYLRLPTRADYREKIWDHAAGALIVAEAGGAVTDIHGRLLEFHHGRELIANRGVVVSNRHAARKRDPGDRTDRDRLGLICTRWAGRGRQRTLPPHDTKSEPQPRTYRLTRSIFPARSWALAIWPPSLRWPRRSTDSSARTEFCRSPSTSTGRAFSSAWGREHTGCCRACSG